MSKKQSVGYSLTLCFFHCFSRKIYIILHVSSFFPFFVLGYMLLNEKGADNMGEFIQSNTLWITPIVSIILTIVIKISAKPEFLTLGFIDYLDFGFDLAISSIIVLIAGIKDNT